MPKIITFEKQGKHYRSSWELCFTPCFPLSLFLRLEPYICGFGSFPLTSISSNAKDLKRKETENKSWPDLAGACSTCHQNKRISIIRPHHIIPLRGRLTALTRTGAGQRARTRASASARARTISCFGSTKKQRFSFHKKKTESGWRRGWRKWGVPTPHRRLHDGALEYMRAVRDCANGFSMGSNKLFPCGQRFPFFSTAQKREAGSRGIVLALFHSGETYVIVRSNGRSHRGAPFPLFNLFCLFSCFGSVL